MTVWGVLPWGVVDDGAPGALPAFRLAEDTGRLFLAAEVEVFLPGAADEPVLGEPWGALPWGRITPANSRLANFSILRASNAGYVSRPTDAGGLRAFPPIMLSALEIDRAMDLAPNGQGAAASWGELRLANQADALTALARDRNADRRPVRIWLGRKQEVRVPRVAGAALPLVADGYIAPQIAVARAHSPAGSEATVIDGTGPWRVVGPNVPRFAGASRRLLVEGGAINLHPHARLPGGAGWELTGVTAGLTVGPDGLPDTAQVLNEGVAASQHHITSRTVAVVAGTSYVISALVAAGTTGLVQLTTLAAGFSGAQTLNWDVATGAVGTPTSGVTGFGADRAGEWSRLWLSGVATGSASTSGFAIFFATALTNSRAPFFTGTGRTLRVAWAQVEAGTVPTTPILPPVGSPAASTRGDDLLTVALADLGVGLPCALLVSVLIPAAATADAHLVEVDTGSPNNRFRLRVSGTSVLAGRVTGGTPADATALGTMTPGTVLRAAIALDGAGLVEGLVHDGALHSVGGGPTAGLTTLRLGRGMFGQILAARLVPYRPSEAGLRALLAALPDA
jgi:hypothetical protein